MTEQHNQIRVRSQYEGDIQQLVSKLPFPECKSLLWQWQFNGSGLAIRDMSLVLEVGNSVCGFNGVMPLRACISGRETTFLWSCDFALEEGYRGRGLGKILKQEMLKKYPEYVIASLGISDKAYGLLQSMGWEPANAVQEFRRECFNNNFKGLIKSSIQHFNGVIGRAKSLCSINNSNTTTQLLTSLPEPDEIDFLWRHCKEGYEAIVTRDYRYLEWKYAQHPLASCSYRYVSLRSASNELQALLIIRLTSNTVEIVDYLGPSKSLDYKQTLLRTLLNNFHSNYSFRLLSSDRYWRRAAKYCGFYTTKTQQRFMVRMPGTYSDTKARTLNWFIMGGDSDGELLAAARSVKQG